ncbi:MAG TPA: BNR repeat-containing protein [Polyangiaceae bacterium]|nr:BNR repeat-containing protein [Polyangiaceae bacterium]
MRGWTQLRASTLGLLVVCAACSDTKPTTNPASGGASSATAGAAGSHAMAGSQSAAGSTATLAGANAGGSGGSAGDAAGGGMAATGGTETAGAGAGTGGSQGAAGSAGAANVAPGLTKDGEVKLSDAGLTLISYGGYLNGEAFQQDAIVTHKGYQYAAFWNTARHVVLARRQLPGGAWSSIELSDYTNTEADAHNTISLGITAADGTLHVAFDHHSSPLHYRKSQAGLVSDPANATWAASSFGATASALVPGSNISQLTYPRFISEPGGDKTLLSARLGTSGSGDEYLWEYSATTHAWTSLGKYIDGITDNINAYLHSIGYAPDGKRLHAAWCWRDTSDAATNHDLLYVYSDDHGRTWNSNAGVKIGTSGTTALTRSSSGLEAWKIGQKRGLINQEAMTVDAAGRVHVLLSHMPDAQADDASFDSARTKSQYFHYWRDPNGKWTRTAMSLPAVAAFRGKLAVASSGNLYAVLPDLRIAAAAVSSSFASWSLLNDTDKGRFFSDPLIDSARLLLEDKLSVVYPQKGAANVWVLDYTLK